MDALHFGDEGSSEQGEEGKGDWQWWHYAIIGGATAITFTVLGFLASGGEERKREYRKKPQKKPTKMDRGAKNVNVRQTSKGGRSGDQEAKQLLKEAHEAKMKHKFRTAIEKYNKATEHIKAATEDDQHLFVGMILQHIGSCYLSLEQFELAKYTLMEAIEILNTKEVDKDTVFDYCSRLSEALVNLGEYTEAERLLQTTISFFERSKAVGETHMYMGIARDTCQLLYRKKREYALAIENAKKVKSIYHSQLGAKDPLTIDARLKVAELYSLNGNHEQALEEVHSLLRDQKSWSSVKDSQYVLQVALHQLIEAGSLEDAKKIALQFLEAFVEEGNDDDDTSTTQIRWFLANIYWLQGKDSEAQRILEVLRASPSVLILTTVSRFMSSKPDTRIRIVVEEDSSMPRFQYVVLLRLNVNSLTESGTALTSSAVDTLSAGMVMEAEFASPDDEIELPPVTTEVTDAILNHHAPEVCIESAVFDVVKKRRYMVTVRVYADASKSELLDTHYQLMDSNFDSETAQRTEHALLRQRASEEQKFELQDRLQLERYKAKYGHRDTLDVVLKGD